MFEQKSNWVEAVWLFVISSILCAVIGVVGWFLAETWGLI